MMSTRDLNCNFVSIIVPVYNDFDRLRLCLSALEEQTYPKFAYEILVVDNGSAKNVEEILNEFPQAKCYREPTPGSYAARNTGICVAQGDILAFTDSDCIPHYDWIEKGVEALKRTAQCGLAAGRIELFYRNPDSPTAIELLDSMIFLQQKSYVENDHFGATANIFTYRHVFDQVGLFNTHMKSGGDAEWGNRVHDAGFVITYAEDSVVQHPTRYSWQQICKKIVRTTGGGYDLHQQDRQRTHSALRSWFKIVADLKPPFRTVLKQLVQADQLTSFEQKAKVFSLLYAIYYVKIWTRIQLQIGYKSQRS